jgi:Ca2+:H+ antiporter
MLSTLHKLKIGWVFYVMLLFVPLTIFLSIFAQSKVLTFFCAILAIIPLARIIGYTTEEITLQTNPTTGGLLSATFGNIIELIIAILALRQGLVRVVEASIIGSILGNLLLLIGLSILVGGLKYKHQRFNNRTAGVSSTMLIITVVGLTIPSAYHYLRPSETNISQISIAVAAILVITYLAGLLFSLRTHKDLFDASDEIRASKKRPIMKKRFAILILFCATCVAAVMAELLVNTIEPAAHSMHLGETFIGVVIIAIITNVAEKSTAINFALENKIDISLEIGLSSAIQVALIVVPVLVFISAIYNYGFLIIFSIFEVVAVLLAVMIINHLAADGRCNWLEGAQLMSVYLILAIVFYFA